MTRTALERAKDGLHPHQKVALDDVLAELSVADRTQLISACGTGKTITSQAVSAAMEATRVLVCLPSINLIVQSIRPWIERYNGTARVVVVCSDETVGRDRRTTRGISDKMIEKKGATVVADADELATIVRNHRPADGVLVVLSTYQSTSKVAEMCRLVTASFDILIADEAHRLASRNVRKSSVRAGKLVLDAAAIRARKRLFLTATPKSYTAGPGVHVASTAASMDDETLFGGVAHKLSLREAIRQGIITDYRVHIMCITADELAAGVDAEDGNVRLDLSVAAFLRAQIELGVRRAIAYCSNRTRSRELARRARKAGILNVESFTGDLTSAEREPLLDMLHGGGFLTNVRCLQEGVDIPALDAVIFTDNRNSKVDITQAIGRVVRTADGKTLGHIILPVLVDPGTPTDDWLAGNGHAAVWEILAQLAVNDTALRAYLDSQFEGWDTEGEDRPTAQDIADGADIIVVHAPRDMTIVGDRLAPELLSKVVLRAAELNTHMGAEWRTTGIELGNWQREHGKWPSRFSDDAQEVRLGDFRQIARTNRNLSPRKRQFLDKVAPGWFTPPNVYPKREQWQVRADELGAYRREHGRWPAQTGDAVALGRFLAKQRNGYRYGNTQGMTDERAAYLDQVAPGWRDGIERVKKE